MVGLICNWGQKGTIILISSPNGVKRKRENMSACPRASQEWNDGGAQQQLDITSQEHSHDIMKNDYPFSPVLQIRHV